MKLKLSAVDLDSLTFIVAYNQAIKAENLTEPEQVKAHVRSFIDTLLVRTNCDVYILVYQDSSHNNFRKYYYSDYKANRTGEAPDFLTLWKATILETYVELGAVKVNTIESDDALAIIHQQFSKDYDITLVHSDKDMLQIPCKHFNFKKKLDEAESIVNTKEAMINWAIQMLIGDYSTDNILGCAILEDKVWKSGLKKGKAYKARKGIALKKAEELLINTQDYEQVEQVLHKAYKEQFKDDWYKEYYKTYQLVTLLKDIPSGIVFKEDRELIFKPLSNTIKTAATLFD